MQAEEEEGEEGGVTTDNLYSRIHQLSEKIKNDLTLSGQGGDTPSWVGPERVTADDEGAGACDKSSPSKKVDTEERLQKAIEKMVKLDARLLELVKVS